MDATDPTGADPVPREVRNAFRSYIAHIWITAIGFLLPVLFTPPFLRLVEQQMIRMGNPAPTARFAMVLGTAFVAVIGLLVLGIELMLARRMRGGRNTARVLLTVLSCLWVALFAFRSDQVVSQLSGGPAVMVGAVLQIAGVLLLMAAGSYMFRPAASRWFRTAGS